MRKYFVGLKDRLLIIEQRSDGFEISEHLLLKQITRLAFDPENKDRIYAATNGDGLWRSENGGKNWEKIGSPKTATKSHIGEGISSSKITSVAVHPTKKVNGNSVVYVGTEPSMLYYSIDNGRSWEEFEGIQNVPSKVDWAFPPRPYTHFVRWITPSYSNANHLAISIEAGAVLNTYDQGEEWMDRPDKSPIDVHTLLAHPEAPGRLYAANGDGSSNSKYAYAESEDEGRSWKYMSEGVEEHPYLYNMVIHPKKPLDRLVSASKNASSAHGESRYSTIYRKVDYDPWVEVADGLPRKDAYTHHLSDDPKELGAFYALNNFGIFHLAADAKEWKQLNIDWSAYEEKRPYCFVVREY